MWTSAAPHGPKGPRHSREGMEEIASDIPPARGFCHHELGFSDCWASASGNFSLNASGAALLRTETPPFVHPCSVLTTSCTLLARAPPGLALTDLPMATQSSAIAMQWLPAGPNQAKKRKIEPGPGFAPGRLAALAPAIRRLDFTPSEGLTHLLNRVPMKFLSKQYRNIRFIDVAEDTG